ncbi:MAG: 50S ribosomal protein L35 [Solirubrobacterales bacterium]
MPKMKSHSGAKKRFRKTGTGKIRGRHAYSSHILQKKRPKRKRRFRNPVIIDTDNEQRIGALLPGKAGRK